MHLVEVSNANEVIDPLRSGWDKRCGFPRPSVVSNFLSRILVAMMKNNTLTKRREGVGERAQITCIHSIVRNL